MDEESRQMYLSDFKAVIRSVDDEVFLKAGYPSGSIVMLPERSDHIHGYFAHNLAGYYQKFPSGFVRVLGPGGKRRTTYIATYAIFETLVLRYVENKLERSSVDGVGDHDIKQLWYVCAIELVRYRVLASKQFFPRINLRTQRSMVKHRHLFTQSGNDFEALKNIAQQLAKPVRGLNQSDSWGVDVFWTMQIVARMLDSGKSFAEAMSYISGD
jgi:hypothetical protein